MTTGIGGGDLASGGITATTPGSTAASAVGPGAAAQPGGRSATNMGARQATGSEDTERAAERERGLESTREGGDAAGRAAGMTGLGRPSGGRVAGRGQPGSGLSAWIAGAENPLAMIRRMEEDLDRVFRAFGVPRLSAAFSAPSREIEQALAQTPGFARSAQWSPQIEVLEREGHLVVRADLPGVKRDDVEVNVDNDVLTIRGERRQEHRETEAGYRRTERSYGSFFRQIPLPEGVDSEQIEASYEDGVLEVVIPSPRPEQQRRKRIDIR